MSIRVQFRQDLKDNWTSSDPVLLQGEPGYEYDTGKFKIGDGTKVWHLLDYSSGSQGETGAAAYVYIAYASADDGTDFTLTFDPDLDYIAILLSLIEIVTPVAGDFAGLWKNYKGAQGIQGVSGSIPTTTATGAADAITADYAPDITLTNLQLCAFVAAYANTTTTPTFAPDSLADHVIVKHGGAALAAGDIPGAGAVCILEYNSANTRWELLNPASVPAATPSVLVQIQHTVVTAVVSGTTIMPVTDSIPQNTEGFEVITCAITPKSATNILLITASVKVSHYVTTFTGGMALFQDTTAGALAAVQINATAFAGGNSGLSYEMVAGTVSETTFKIRVGPSAAGTIYVNTVSGATGRAFGGVAATTLTIFEYTP